MQTKVFHISETFVVRTQRTKGKGGKGMYRYKLGLSTKSDSNRVRKKASK